MVGLRYKALCLLSIAYLSVVGVFLFLHQMWFSPDQFFAVALILTLFLGRFKQFVRDWSFPTVLFLSYEYLRGLAPNLTAQAHSMPMINFDQSLFGFIPAVKLQNLLFSQDFLHWYDYLTVGFY